MGPDWINAIRGGALAIAGLILVMSRANLFHRRIDCRIGLGASLFGVGLFMLVTDFPEYAMGFTILATLALAFAAFQSLTENRRIRSEDRELASKKRRLDEVQYWINEVLKIKSACATGVGNPSIWRQRSTDMRIIVANKTYIEKEAKRLDEEFPRGAKNASLVNQIGRLSFILGVGDAQSLSNEGNQREIEDRCFDVLQFISDIKAKLKL